MDGNLLEKGDVMHKAEATTEDTDVTESVHPLVV